MNYLKFYLIDCLKNDNLNNIVDQYLMGPHFKNVAGINRSANYHGVDLFISKPILLLLCEMGHLPLIKKYIFTYDKRYLDLYMRKACSNDHLETAQYLTDFLIEQIKYSNNNYIFHSFMVIACESKYFQIATNILNHIKK